MEVTPLGPDLDPRSLAGRAFDLAIGRFHTAPEDLVVSELFQDGFRCLVAPSALAPGAKLDRALYEALPHVVIAPPGKWRTGLQNRMEGTGLRRNTAVVVSHFLSAPPMVARLGGIATVPERVALLTAEPYGLLNLPVPAELGTFPSQVAWHPRLRRDPGHVWLRKLVGQIVQDYTAPPKAER